MSENWEISIFRKNSNYLIHLKYFKWNLESYVKNYGKGSCFNFYFKIISGYSGLKDLIFVWKSNLKIKIYLLTYNQQNKNFYYFPCNYSLSHLSFNSNFIWKTFLMGFYRVRILKRRWDSYVWKSSC